MDHLSKLENQSIYILREAFNKFEHLAMLWSIGKDSTVMLWLARKAFFGHVPFPLVHVDTTYKIPSMIEYRDQLVKDWKLQLVTGKNKEVLKSGVTFPNGKATRVECCGTLKKDAMKQVLDRLAGFDEDSEIPSAFYAMYRGVSEMLAQNGELAAQEFAVG